MASDIYRNDSTLRYENRSNYAYDLSKNILSEVEVFESDAINNSIENILLTLPVERVNLLPFGSSLQLYVFETITDSEAFDLFESILDSIELWENRIILDRQNAKLDLFPDANYMRIQIPYVIKKSGIRSNFKKKIIY